MLITTDAAIHGRTFTPLGLVLAEEFTGRRVGDNHVGRSVNAIAQQATALGANAIVGLRFFLVSNGHWAVYGNAIRLD
jgi:uncharacterized protein YbjQ (UPF0145 family)